MGQFVGGLCGFFFCWQTIDIVLFITVLIISRLFWVSWLIWVSWFIWASWLICVSWRSALLSLRTQSFRLSYDDAVSQKGRETDRLTERVAEWQRTSLSGRVT